MLHREYQAPVTHNDNLAPSSDVRTPDPKPRRAAVLAARLAGMTCRQISATSGLSKARVYQLIVQARRDVAMSQRAVVIRARNKRLANEEARCAAFRPVCAFMAELLTRRALAAWSALGRERA